MKKLLFLFILIAYVFVEHTVIVADGQAPIHVKAAVLRHFPPQYTLSETGRPQGFAFDIMEEIARRANLKVDYVVIDSWGEAFAALKGGQVDLIPNQGITDRRKEWFSFSRPVETFPVSIFVRKNEENISTLQSLRDKKVAVVKLNVGEILVKDEPDSIVQKYDHVEDALFNLLSGNSDALIFPEPVLWKLARQAKIEDQIKVAGAPLIEIQRAVSVAKHNKALLKRIDAAVQTLIKSDKYKEIYIRWYGRPAPFWTAGRVGGFMAALLVGVVLLMAFWRYRSIVNLNRMLKENIEKRKLAEQDLKSSYETLERKVEERTQELQNALSEVKTLSGMLPICSRCKKIRDDTGYWNQIEQYIRQHSDVEFSHSICQECAEKLYPELYREDDDRG